MLTYDPDNTLLEVSDPVLLESVADVLATSEGAHRLCGKESGTAEERKAATLTFITIGPTDEPLDSGQYTLPELEARGVELNLMAPVEGGKTVTTNGLDVEHGGDFLLTARYQVKEAELAERNKQNLYLAFLDCCAKIEHDLASAFVGQEGKPARERPRLGGINRVQGPAWPPLGYASTQGEYIFCTWSIPWGDNPGGGGGAEA